LVISVELESRKTSDRLYKGCIDCLKFVHSGEFLDLYESWSDTILVRDLLYYNLKTGEINNHFEPNGTILIGAYFPGAINVLVSNIDKNISKLLIASPKNKFDLDSVISGCSVLEQYEIEQVISYLEDFIFTFPFSTTNFIPWFLDDGDDKYILTDTITEDIRSKLSNRFWKRLDEVSKFYKK
jgi:hypothetical protein